MAAFKPGDVVVLANHLHVLAYSGERAVLARFDKHGTPYVRLEDGTEIPVPPEIISRPPTEPRPAPRPANLSKIASGMVRIFVAVVPNDDGSAFRVFLVNPLTTDLYVRCRLFFNGEFELETQERVEAVGTYLLDELTLDDVNDKPRFELHIEQILTAGTEDLGKHTIKFRAQKLRKSPQSLPVIDLPGILIWEMPPPKTPISLQPPGGTHRDDDDETGGMPCGYPTPNLEDVARFPRDIDLHIEKLRPQDYKRLSPSEILRIQVQAAEDYVDEACRLGVSPVYLIHGVGKGRLRDILHRHFSDDPRIKRIANEFHLKYGEGASVVEFW